MLDALCSDERALLELRRLLLRWADCGHRLPADCAAWPGDRQQRRAGPGLEDRSPAPCPSGPADERLRPLRL